MRSAKRPGPTLPLTLLLLLPAVAGCVSMRSTLTPQSACSSLVPQAWRLGVDGAPIYGPTPDVGDLEAFADAQTAALDKANGRTVDSIAIVEKCEARDQAAAAQITQPWWKLF